ncbi:MAG: c-type cytochrome [Planctomycetaceae bacterium]
MIRQTLLFAALLGGFGLHSSLVADDDNPFDGYSPGLLGTYRSTDAATPNHSWQRIDGEVAFDWGPKSPGGNLSSKQFAVDWQGTLLVKTEGTYRLHAFLSGQAAVSIDGKVHLKGEREEPGWVSGPQMPIEFGFLPIEVHFVAGPTSTIKLYWSAEGLPLEPLPWHQLYHEQSLPESVALIERGRQLFDVYRCNRCHQQEGDLVSPEAPPFLTITADLDSVMLRQKLRHHQANASTSRMPSFGFSEEEAHSVATWLEHFGQPPQLPSPPAVKKEEEAVAEGKTLFHSVGCLACHRVGETGSELTQGPHPFSGGDLSHLGGKRSVDWIYTWLRQPERTNPAHEMPQFDLKPTQLGAIARYLASLDQPNKKEAADNKGAVKKEPIEKESTTTKPVDATKPDDADSVPLGKPDRPGHPAPPSMRNTDVVIAGRQLAYASRCANCHKTPAYEIDLRGLPKLDEVVSDWDNSCLGDKADRKTHRPHYPQADRLALRAYVTARVNLSRPRLASTTPPASTPTAPDATPSPVTPPVANPTAVDPLSSFAHGQVVIERKNCLACHERGSNRGIVSIAGDVATSVASLRGKSEDLIPPNLTAVGDRMQYAALNDAVAGEQKQHRMPWLMVQMPKFNHRPAERAALSSYLVGSDRIPPRAPDAPFQRTIETPKDDSATLLTSRELVGAGGFSCIACHQFGDYVPKNVAPGSRGSDLKGVASRVRPEFFLRWCRSPLSIVPGVEMPSYESRPVKGVLDEDINRQLAELWTAINDPRFEAPTNPTQVEQLITLRPAEAPRVIRDVFTVSPENNDGVKGGTVARSFAIGFDNGHSLLFDLDTGSLREWRWGDFARQRTEGKSWYWDMAGQHVMTGFNNKPEFSLFTQDGTELPPMKIDGRSGKLLGYTVIPLQDKEGVFYQRRYELWFQPPARSDGTPATSTDGDTFPVIIKPIVLTVTEEMNGFANGESTGLIRGLSATCGGPYDIRFSGERTEALQPTLKGARIQVETRDTTAGKHSLSVIIQYITPMTPALPLQKPMRVIPPGQSPIRTTPGFDVTRLKLPAEIMPTSLCWTADGTLAFTSLKGDVYLVEKHESDSNGENDDIAPQLTKFEEGLPAPFGILADKDQPHTLLVVTKGELLSLRDTDGDGHCNNRRVLADGWGYTDNYHDWVTGLARDADGNLYVGTGSDYSQGDRDRNTAKWKGKVLKLTKPTLLPNQISLEPYNVEAIADELRYPMGIAFDAKGRLFVSDQQGVANTFNEINHIIPGRRYGVRALLDEPDDRPETLAAVKIPHPFTRSINGIFFIPEVDETSPLHPFAGHGIGCEYDGKFLMRFSLQEVAGELQGASYLFTQKEWPNKEEMLLGPICGGVSPAGDIYIGSIHDSGWLGGLNTGEIVRLRPTGNWPNGIREVRATSDGFQIEFLQPLDATKAKDPANYDLSAYTRVWQGSYATPDSERHSPKILRVDVQGKVVALHLETLKEGFFYELNCAKLGSKESPLFPAEATYTLNRIPAAK